MSGDVPQFADLIADAYYAVRALDDSTATSATIRRGRSVYSQLLDYRKSASMTEAQSALVQTALDLIWARLRSAQAGSRSLPAMGQQKTQRH
jgi:hypothetical protein